MTMFDIWAYETSTGRSPVLDYIESVPKFDQAKIARTIDLLSSCGFVLLHASAKQTKKTPLGAIAVAEQRMNDWVDRMSARSPPSQRGL